MKSLPRPVSAATLAAFLPVLVGCVVGPDFRGPPATDVASYIETALPAQTASAGGAGGTAQRFVAGAEVPGQWWTLFHSPALDGVIRAALTGNPTLEAGQAALRAAVEQLHAASGAAHAPRIDARGSAARQRFLPAAIGMPQAPPVEFSLYNVAVDVGFNFDLFGRAARELEALQAEVDYRHFQLAATRVTLSANIATSAIREAALRAQLDATRGMIAAQEKQLGLVERQAALGGAARSDVLSQRAELAQTRAALPAIERELAQTRHVLAALVGRSPAEARLPEFSFASFELPAALPVSLPSALVRQRPDILAAEALLHRASANVGIAEAGLYPQLTLTGGVGTLANRSGDLFGPGSSVWNYGAGLLQPLFHGGQLTAQRRAAIAAYDQAVAQYREVVLRAFQNVADTLRALELDAQVLAAQADALAAAREALELSRQRYDLGAGTYLSLLIAERQYHQARLGHAQARAARLADTAALFQSLGGGWWHPPSHAPSPPDQPPAEAPSP